MYQAIIIDNAGSSMVSRHHGETTTLRNEKSLLS